MADNIRVPNVKREDFLARLERARKAGGYTEESVHTLVDTVVSNTNSIIAALNSSRENETANTNPQTSSAEADRLTEQARDLFEQQSRTAAEFVSAAQVRAERIEAEAHANAESVRVNAESAAQELTDSTDTWAGEVRASVQQEIEDQRAAAVRDLEDVRIRRERLATEANDIVDRLQKFYQTQLDSVSAIADGSATGGNPLIEIAEAEENSKPAKSR